MTDQRDDFERFLKTRENAAASYVRGDATPLGHIVARELPATFFGPGGGHRRGPSQVWSEYERGAHAFAPGGDTRFEILQSAASGDVAYWTGYQHATVAMRAKPKDAGDAAAPEGEETDPEPPATTTMKLRITEVFRKEAGEWKLVHRHADARADEDDAES